MFGRLFKYLVYILIIELICFIALGVWIIHDGSQDNIQTTDAALVPGYGEIKNGLLSPALSARLDRAAQLFDQGKFSYIIVSGVTPPGEDDESAAMSRYLQAHAVPATAIIENHPGVRETVDSVDSIKKSMEEQNIKSLLLITDYYRLVHLKILLSHVGENQLAQAHIGEWKKEDGQKVMDEDFAICKDIYIWYVVPRTKELSKKAMEEAQVLQSKLSSETGH